ncbi:MAG: hypothetical protein AABZ44_07025 [Elusimicrobiota bacterium]
MKQLIALIALMVGLTVSMATVTPVLMAADASNETSSFQPCVWPRCTK